MRCAAVLNSCLLGLLCGFAPWKACGQDQTPGRVDTTFEVGPGFRALKGASLLGAQSSGKIIVGSGTAGAFENISGYAVTNLARLNTNGTLDPGFRPVLSAGPNPATVEQVVVLRDDRVLVSGDFDTVNGEPVRRLVRLDPDGGLDPTFVRNTVAEGDASRIAPAAGGKLLVSLAGAPRLGRLLPDGSRDPSFQITNLLEEVYGVVEQADGSLIVVGRIAVGGPISLFRFRADGSHDDGYHSPAFAPPATPSHPPHLTLQPDGKMLVAGTFTNVDGYFRGSVARLEPGGSVDTGFVPGRRGLGAAEQLRVGSQGFVAVTRTVTGIGLQEDGRIVAAGDFFTFEGRTGSGVVRMNADGSRDTNFLVGPGAMLGTGRTVVRGLTLDRKGFVVLVGDFDQVNSLPRDGLARLHGRRVAPGIIQQPTNQTVEISARVEFAVRVVGSEPISYQWKRNGRDIPGATGRDLIFPYALESNTDVYSVAITNDVGWATSQVCRLTVAGFPKHVPGTQADVFLFVSGYGVIAGIPDFGGTNHHPLGKIYTIEAWPALGSRFLKWSGDISSTNQKIRIIATSRVVIQANFIPDPQQPRSGRYAAVFYNTNGLERGPYGTLFFTMNELGRYSSRWTFPGRTISRVGHFDLGLHSELQLAGDTGAGPLMAYLSIVPNTDQVAGIIRDGGRESHVMGYRLGYGAKLVAARSAGDYTVAIAGADDPAEAPPGFGIGTISVKRTGSVFFRGALADGTRLTHAIPISGSADWAMMQPLPHRRGVLLGWMRINLETNQVINGSLLWARPASGREGLYPAGFTNRLAVIGSRYHRPTADAGPLTLTHGVVVLDQGDLDGSLTNALLQPFGRQIEIAAPNLTGLRLGWNPSSGRIRGAFIHPRTLERTPIEGVLLQQQNSAAGFFLGTNEGGAFYLGDEDAFPLVIRRP